MDLVVTSGYFVGSYLLRSTLLTIGEIDKMQFLLSNECLGDCVKKIYLVIFFSPYKCRGSPRDRSKWPRGQSQPSRSPTGQQRSAGVQARPESAPCCTLQQTITYSYVTMLISTPICHRTVLGSFTIPNIYKPFFFQGSRPFLIYSEPVASIIRPLNGNCFPYVWSPTWVGPLYSLGKYAIERAGEEGYHDEKFFFKVHLLDLYFICSSRYKYMKGIRNILHIVSENDPSGSYRPQAESPWFIQRNTVLKTTMKNKKKSGAFFINFTVEFAHRGEMTCCSTSADGKAWLLSCWEYWILQLSPPKNQ